MSRVIKFRAKSKVGGDWVYGYYYKFNKGNSFIHTLEDSEPEVEEKTLGEFTGLTDKNDNEIYEGDVVQTPMGWIGNVHYVGDRFMIDNHRLAKDTKPFVLSFDWNQVEVIGNIYENKELLEGDDEKKH